MLASCKHKADTSEASSIDTLGLIAFQARKVSKLYTAEYKVHKIVTHTDDAKLEGKLMGHDINLKLPLGKRHVAIPIDVTLKAYIDMTDFSVQNIHKQGEKIEIVLPNPEITITSSKIDHEGIRQHVALLRSNFSDDELTNYEKQGRQAVVESINNMGIYETARHSAANILIPLLNKLGYKNSNIRITFDDNQSKPTLKNIDNRG